MTLLLQAQPNDWVLFIGRFHPLLVHLPIGFLLLAGVLEVGRRLGRISLTNSTMSAILFWSAVSATGACGAGYLLSLGGGYDAHILDEHRWQGIAVAGFAWVAWMASSDALILKIPFSGPLYGVSLLACLGFLLAAGHHGGALTHGADYLSQYTPAPLRSLAGLPPRQQMAAFVATPITDIQQAMVYEQIVNPILQSRCVQCHNAGKSKGDLRMDTPEQLRKGGGDGPVFMAGKAVDSELVKRCLLDETDEHHMPPTGKTPLTPQQITLLTWWIDQGASFSKKVRDLPLPDAVRPALAALGGGPVPGGKTDSAGTLPTAQPGPVSPVLTMTVPLADPATVAVLEKAGLRVMPLSKTNNQLEISAINAPSLTDGQVAVLAKLSPQVVWLKLSDTRITDAAMPTVAMLKNLQKLHLERTVLTDAGLKQLTALPYLEYLNLYGTRITDAGLASLAGLKALRTVYVWQTDVTPAGIAALKKALPNVEIIGGAVL